MKLTPADDSEEEIGEILHGIKAYQTKIVLFASLRIFLQNNGFSVFIENKRERLGKEPDEPDIFVQGDSFTFIEEKGSLPENHDRLQRELETILMYESEHVFQQQKFIPDVVLLCPSDVYKSRRRVIRQYEKTLTVLTYPFPIEDPINLQLVQGEMDDRKLAGLISDKVFVPHARTIIPTIKFLREEPPVPYTAWAIWQVVWASVPAFRKDFEVRYSTILEECQKFYPSWLSQDIEQITYGRVNDALELLRFAGWVGFDGKLSLHTEVHVRYSKGDKIRSETLHFLSREYLRLIRRKERARSHPRSRVIVKRLVASEKDQRLTDFMKGAKDS